MKYQFVTYEIAIKLKQLGFNELCITRYGETSKKLYESWKPMKNSEDGEDFTAAPLWQQVIEWFDKIYNITFYPEKTEYGYMWTIKSSLINNKNNEIKIVSDLKRGFLESHEVVIKFLFDSIELKK